MVSDDSTLQSGGQGSFLSRGAAEALNGVVEFLRTIVEWAGKISSLLFVPLVLFTVFDVILRKTGKFQIDIIEAAGPFGVMFQSTLLQEMQWHVHTALFAMVLGYGYINNTHVRVDLVRESLAFRKKAWTEMIGCTIFLIPFSLVLIYFATIFAYDSWEIGEVSASLVGLSNRWIIKSILVIGLVVALLAGIAVWLQTFVTLFGPRDLRFPLMTLEWPEEEGDRMEGKERLKVDLDKSIDEELEEKTKSVLSGKS